MLAHGSLMPPASCLLRADPVCVCRDELFMGGNCRHLIACLCCNAVHGNLSPSLLLLTPVSPPRCRSMFHGREASQRIPTAWASHSLVAAVRLLLRDALADPANKRFILMSGALRCAVLCCAALHCAVLWR